MIKLEISLFYINLENMKLIKQDLHQIFHIKIDN